MMRFKILVLAVGTALTLTGTPVLAQQDGQPESGGMGGMMGHSQDRMMGHSRGGMMDQGGKRDGCPMDGMGNGMKHGMMRSIPMMEARLAYIKADLEITDAQTPAWDAYTDAVRAQHATTETMRADMMKAEEGGGVLERMDARIKTMERKVASLKALKPVTEALYTQLTDEQKKEADQLLGDRCGMM